MVESGLLARQWYAGTAALGCAGGQSISGVNRSRSKGRVARVATWECRGFHGTPKTGPD